MRILASFALIASVAFPAMPAHAAEPGPACVGYDVLECATLEEAVTVVERDYAAVA